MLVHINVIRLPRSEQANPDKKIVWIYLLMCPSHVNCKAIVNMKVDIFKCDFYARSICDELYQWWPFGIPNLHAFSYLPFDQSTNSQTTPVVNSLSPHNKCIDLNELTKSVPCWSRNLLELVMCIFFLGCQMDVKPWLLPSQDLTVNT